MNDTCELLVMITGLTTAVLLILYAICWVGVGIPIGASYNTVGTIELYEHSSFCGEHTWIVLKTLGGTEAQFTLVGYHTFKIGSTYEIQTICERGGFIGLHNWYEVVDIIER